MEAYQIDPMGNIVGLEEEPTGPSPNRIKTIIYDALNQNGYILRGKHHCMNSR